jgi:hypothetical protein
MRAGITIVTTGKIGFKTKNEQKHKEEARIRRIQFSLGKKLARSYPKK